MSLEFWATIAATLLGPVLAVQAQKWIERARAEKERKELIFSTLMATRNARMSSEHVRALNMIDLVFDSRKTSDPDWEVHNAWKAYIDHLNEDTAEKPEVVLLQMYENRDNLFFNLLESMSKSLGYSFDRSVLKRHGYSPKGHEEVANEQEEVRRRLIAVLGGIAPLKMEITNLPSSSEPN